jgi:hypothetical protein
MIQKIQSKAGSAQSPCYKSTGHKMQAVGQQGGKTLTSLSPGLTSTW